MRDIKGLIFDMDGTLIENMAYHFAAFEEQARRHGYKFLRPVDSRYYGWNNLDIFPEIVPAADLARLGSDFLSKEKEVIYRELYAGHVTLTAGLDALLADARAHGVKCAIGSAGPRINVEFIMREAKLNDRMDAYVCLDDVTHCKPDPEIFLTACQRLHLDPAECVVFEDGIPGIKAARAAGCAAVGVATTMPAQSLTDAGADLVVRDFTGMTIASLSEQL